MAVKGMKKPVPMNTAHLTANFLGCVTACFSLKGKCCERSGGQWSLRCQGGRDRTLYSPWPDENLLPICATGVARSLRAEDAIR